MADTVYLITGANRGLGRAFLSTFLARPSVTVIAAVRDPSNETSKSLSSLPKGSDSKLTITKYDAQNETDAANLAKFLEQEKIPHLDVVIANAGIAQSIAPLATVPFTDFKDHIETNAYGPLLLFQAVKPLLDKARQPQFIALGSPMGSIGGMEMRPFPMGAYGASKAILHYITRKIHFENENLISFSIDPGWAQTDMGNGGAKHIGLDQADTTVEASTAGMVTIIDNATRESTSGRFPRWDSGEEFPW